MTEQSTALRLADDLESTTRGYPPVMMAASELRRLSAVNHELLEALDEIAINTHDDTAERVARAAIAKAEGQT